MAHPSSTIVPQNQVTTKLFYTSARGYIYDREFSVAVPDGQCDLYLPLDIDTEYQSHKIYVDPSYLTNCTNMTVQVKGIHEEVGTIFAHPDIASIARHPVFKHESAVLDYLELIGHQVKIKWLKNWNSITNIPYIQIDLYAFFAVAELFRIFKFNTPFVYDVESLCTSYNEKQGIIKQQRRLTTHHRIQGKYYDYITLPWILNLNGYDYRVRLSIYDTCAVHGVASYKDFCTNSGLDLQYKDNFSKAEKAKMLDMYVTRPEDFDNYALGDLHNHKALLANASKFKNIYQQLNIAKYYTEPRLTIGATVSRIIESKINNLFNAEPGNREFINTFCRPASADYLKRDTISNRAYNLKVDGGRCRNNRPLDTSIKGVIVDIDIDGCYGNGLREQLYPLGVPVSIGGEINDSRYHKPSLREFLDRYGNDLVPGLWQARVSTPTDYSLKYPQDYLASWIPPKDLNKIPTDTEIENTDEWWNVDNLGMTRIFNHEVHHAIITHDFIQWLDNVASKGQKKELLDCLLVDTAMWYPATERVNSINELLLAHQNHDGVSTSYVTKIERRNKKHSIEVNIAEKCYSWYAVNLGELLITPLILERKKYKKKTPENNLLKLIINTVYGVMVSPFFSIGNVVVGNNITARARALAWCMEKGLHGWQSITDGCAFDLNRVLYPREDSRITSVLATNLYLDKKSYDHTFKPLGNYDNIKVDFITSEDGTIQSSLKLVKDTCVTTLNPEESLKWIDNAAIKHLQNLFPNLDVLHKLSTDLNGLSRIGQFEFESKGIYDTATFHGTANYSLGINGNFKYAMRSYSKKEHDFLDMDEQGVRIAEADVIPGNLFLDKLINSESVVRNKPFIKERILKVGDYRKNHTARWDNGDIYPGCTVEIASLIREFSLTQFTFKTLKQFKSWEREYKRLLDKHGHSYEMYFLNDDGTLDYQAMIETVDEKIHSGATNFFDGIDKRTANTYRQASEHKAFKTYKSIQEDLKKRYFDFHASDDSDDGIEYESD